MKVLIVFFLILSSAYADTVLVLQRSTQKGGEQKTLMFAGETLKVLKNSNAYDKHPDYRLGEFQTKMTDDLHKNAERLSQISKALQEAEKMLEDKDSSFKKLEQNRNPHGDKIYLDRILVSENSSYYQELMKLVTDLDTSHLNQVQGARITKDKKQLEIIKDGKVASKEAFIVPFFCDKPKLPAQCILRDQGTVNLK